MSNHNHWTNWKCISSTHSSSPESSTVSTKRYVTDVEHQTIEDFFTHFKHSQHVLSVDNKEEVGFANEEERLEGMLERVRMQMMLNSASKEEVALRRQKWRELSIRLQGVKHWDGFSQVFMVSAATGEGIDKLRVRLLVCMRVRLLDQCI